MDRRNKPKIPFCVTSLGGKEIEYVSQAVTSGAVAGDGPFSKKCHRWLRDFTGTGEALLTHSCTAALEMGAMLADIKPGDEVIMPSYTFVSTANAFALRGATPVFVDIRPDTLNLDEKLVAEAVTAKTKAIVPVHYAGVSCEMDEINEIAAARDILVIEDAAQGIDSSYKGRHLGTLGHLGALSFHQTKNISSGEGGALLINVPEFLYRAEIIREKGTDRSSFYRGQVDKYTWRDIGSSFLPSDILAAFLLGQFEALRTLQDHRMRVWTTYFAGLKDFALSKEIQLPFIPDHCVHNAHMFYMILPSEESRVKFIDRMSEAGIATVFHYVPLHSAPKGKSIGKVHGSMHNTENISARLVRLPIYSSMSIEDAQYVAEKVVDIGRDLF